MKESSKFGLGPFVLLTFIYFIVGFLTTVNGQFQGPLQVAFLSDVTVLRNTLVTLIPFFFFLGYLLNSSTGGRWIDRFGYKTTLIRDIVIMVFALVFYLLASILADRFGVWGFDIGHDFVPYGYLVFLLGSFLMGTSAALLQVVINPYIASYQLPNTQAVQRVSIVGAINSIGTTIAPFFVTAVMFAGAAIENVSASHLLIPFGVMILFIGGVTVVTSRLKLPNIEGTFNSKKEGEQQRSIWSFRHLRLGVIAIFFYVGAEVAIGINVNLHALELLESGRDLSFFGHDNVIMWGLHLGIPALLATLYWGGLMVGRIMSSFVNFVSPRTQLLFTATAAIALTIVAIASNNLWVLVAVGLCHSIMWAAIFSLSVEGLGEYTSKASGLFMMGVFGGAIFPLIQGYMADSIGSWRWTWGIVIVCELVILYYALWGSRIKESDRVK